MADTTTPLQGFLNIHKPSGITSRKVVDEVLRLLRLGGVRSRDLPKVGHAGTLDPLACGVLVVCIGAATRLIDVLHSLPKKYLATFLLGRRSDTEDIEGQVVEVAVDQAQKLSRLQIEAVLPEFRGGIEQVPPAFSAVRVEGKRAYELARRGRPIALQAKPVEIYHLEVVRFEPPELQLDIECSSGTYIRALGRDLGERLGCGAVMSALVRTQVASFKVSDAIPFDAFSRDVLTQQLQPLAAAVQHLPAYECTANEVLLTTHGRSFAPRSEGWWTKKTPWSETKPSGSLAMLNSEGVLIAVGCWTSDGSELRPHINFVGIG